MTTVRRLEVITGTGRRRRFSDDDKARVVEETLAPGAIVSHVARRNGLTPQQLFTWRRQARERAEASKAVSFVPVVLAAAPAADSQAEATIIEIVIGATTVRVPPGADATMLKLVLRAVKAAS
ncbi:MAG: transposase [Terriglobales bacterium]